MALPKTKIADLQEKIGSRDEWLIRLALRELDTLPQDDPMVWELRGKAHYNRPRRRHQEALASFRRAYQLSESPDHLMLYAGVLLETDASAEGVEILERLIREGYQNPGAYVALASHFLAIGDTRRAIAVADEALGVPHFVWHYQPFHIAKSIAYEMLGETEQAKQETLKVLSLLLDRDLTGYADVPVSAAEAVAQLVEPEWRDRYLATVNSWILEAQEGDESVIWLNSDLSRLGEHEPYDWGPEGEPEGEPIYWDEESGQFMVGERSQ